MSEILEAILELFLEFFTWPDSTAKRIFWGIVILLLVGVIWGDLR